MGETIATVGDLAGICGHDGTSWEKILIDASKRLVVAVASVVASDVQMHGYYDGAWQKAPMPWGYCDTVVERNYEPNAAAGINTLASTAVPAGEVHVIQTVYASNLNTNPTAVVLGLKRGATTYSFHREAAPGAGASVENANPIIAKEGDIIVATFTGCVLNDDIILIITGYKVDLDL